MAGILTPPRHARAGLWSRLDERGRGALLFGVAGVVGVIGAQGSTLARALVGGFGFVVFVLIAFSHRDTALTLVVVWLALLGFVRRLLIPFAGWSANDPLLLVSPAAALTLWFIARRQAPRRQSALTGLVAFLLMWVTAHVFNPNEGSTVVAFQGLLFYFTPLMWFFVGRTLVADQHRKVHDAVLIASVGVVALGLYQSFVGFLPFELTWLDLSGQGAAIFMPGFRVRPFSTLVSPQEYGHFLQFAIIILWSRWLHRPSEPGSRRWLLPLLLVALVALFFQASRGILVFCLLALAVVTVVRLRSLLVLMGVVAAGAVLVFSVTARDVPTTTLDPEVQSLSQGESDVLVQHQLSGLTNPSTSSASVHMELIVQGFAEAGDNPLGRGVSNSTIAARKADAAAGPTPENDIGITSVALGIPAGIALLGLVIAGIGGAASAYRRAPTAHRLAWLGMFVATFGQWLNGSLYAVSTLLFLGLGGVARDRELAGTEEETG